ncbi:MAG: hypothetical protein E6Q76_03730 [Rhizobium sp.]|nr:MAG: hypothetical protein E6Q76_03730 [Rhizobium sp.]
MGTAELTFVGPSTTLQNIDVKYIIDDAVDYDDARATMMAVAPLFLGNFVPVDFHIDPKDDSDTLWEGSITYGPRTNNSPDGENDPTYSFELGVQTTKVLTSLQTVGKYGDRPPDFKRSINVQDDNTVEGVDLNFPVFSWTETHYLPYSFVNRAYFTTLFNVTAKMNIGPFRDFMPGEVLLLGVNGSKRYSAADWEMQFKFIASPNVTNLKIGPDITVSSKLGHDYLWAKYVGSEDNDNMAMVRIPKHVYVERVYQFEDYNKLKLRNPLAM